VAEGAARLALLLRAVSDAPPGTLEKICGSERALQAGRAAGVLEERQLRPQDVRAAAQLQSDAHAARAAQTLEKLAELYPFMRRGCSPMRASPGATARRERACCGGWKRARVSRRACSSGDSVALHGFHRLVIFRAASSKSSRA